MKKIVTAAVLATSLAGCADQHPVTQTNSGYPEATFSNTTLGVVENKLVGVCSQVGAQVTEETANMIVCDKPMDGQAGIFTRLLIGNGYSTPTIEKLRFVLNSVGDSVHVAAYRWAETQMVGGQVNRIELGAGDLQQLLYGLGADDVAAGRYSADSRVALELLKPAQPQKSDGRHYVVGASSCHSRQAPDASSPVVRSYYQGAALTVYERNGLLARVSPDGAPPEWVLFAWLVPAG